MVGKTNIGGLIGFTNAQTVNVSDFTGNNLKVNADDNYINLDKSSRWQDNYSNGIGGVIGTVYNGEIQFENIRISGLSITNKNKTTASTDIGFGGLVGAANAPENSNGYMKNIHLSGTITITDNQSHVSTGGLIGYLADKNFSDWEISDKKTSEFEISDVQIGCDSSSTVNLKGFQVGGLIGMLKDGSVDLTIGSETSDESGKTTVNSVAIGNSKESTESTKNVTISENSFSSSNNKTSLSAVIGITCNNPTVTIQNLYLGGIAVTSANYTSLILAKNAKAISTLNIKNMKAINCSVVAKTNGQSGFLYGCSDTTNKDLTVKGYNILLKDCSIGDNAGALFGGNNATGTVQLVAVSAVNCTGKENNFGTVSSASYVIRANYTGSQKNETGNDPYVPSNPYASGSLKNTTTDDSTITGDGAAFSSDGKTAVGTQIAKDAQDTTITKSKTYYSVSGAAEFYNTNANDASKPRISTYSEAGGNASASQNESSDGTESDSSSSGNTGMTQPYDFPVLLIPAVGKSEVNTAVYHYISLLTNFDSSTETLKGKLQVNGITATTYRWDGSTFKKVTDANETPALTIAKDGTISATTGCYDNTKNQFTLLDIPFKDPTDDENTYHLYIPVVVQKLLNYRFFAAASVGTNYYTSHYDDLKKQVLASHTEQVTALISFEYERTKAEWQAAIDNGENLLWDFDKVLRINTQSDDKLPEGTKLTLVDRNSKQAYFTEYNGSDDVLKFLDFDGYENNRSYLCDGLSMQAIEQNSETSGKVLYVEVNPNTNATLRIGEKYYRPAQSTDTGKKYSITVEGDGTDKFLLKEQFYLTIQTPETDTSKTAFVNVLIECESSLKNSKSSDMLPNKLERYTNKNWYTRNESENRIVIGDFFNETVMLSTSSEELMSETNNSITLDIQSKIEFRSQEWFKRYQSYAKGTSLYQRFDLQLNQWKPANKGNTANFAAGTVVKVEYFKDGASVAGGGTEMLPETSVVELKFPEAIDFNAGNATEGDSSLPSVTLKAEVTLTYDTGCIVNQFIERSESMAREGLQFLAYSHLAYSEDALKRSSVSKSVTDNSRRFYRENQEAATLLYNSYGIDEQTKMDQLGINGRSANEVAISTYATYDVSKLSAAAASATTLKYSFRLLRKDNKGKYVEVSSNASDLYRINNGSVTWLNSSQETVSSDKLSATSGSVSLTGGLDPNQGIEFNIPLNINTGTILEGQKEIYSNYQVELTVSLYKDETLITGSKVTDYVIYTNAKIKTELIE